MGLQQIQSEEFIKLGSVLHPYWNTRDEDYEKRWLGVNSPFLKNGRISLYRNDTSNIRICVLQENNISSFQNLFCFYARKEFLPSSELSAFFKDLDHLLQEQSIYEITGPLQFSTWHPYRFVKQRNDVPFFPGEQKLPEEWFQDFVTHGFKVCADYESILVKSLPKSLGIVEKMGIKKALPNMEFSSFEGNSFKEIASELFNLSLEVFKGNFGYSSIRFEEFSSILVDHTPDQTFLITARERGKLTGFAYSYSIGNWGSSNLTTCVLKTLGVHPDYRNQKIGYGLGALTHEYWNDQSHQQIIHAYMKTDNHSKSMSSHFGKAICTYSLLRKTTKASENG